MTFCQPFPRFLSRHLLTSSVRSYAFPPHLPPLRPPPKKDPHAVARSMETLDPNGGGVRGIVVNRVSKSLLGGLYTSHHFYAIVPWNKHYRPGNAATDGATPTLPVTAGGGEPENMETSAAAVADGGGEEEGELSLAAAAAVAATAAAAAAAGAGAAGAAEAGADSGANDKAWFVVDSKSAHAEIIGGAAELALHLGMEARENQGHVFVVSDGSGEEEAVAVAAVAPDEMVAG